MFKRLLKSKLTNPIICGVISLIVFIIALLVIVQINTMDENISNYIFVETFILFIAFISFVVFAYMAVIIPMILKENIEQKKCLKIIKENLSAEFKVVYLKKERRSKLTCLLLESTGETLFQAKINENDQIYLIIGKDKYSDKSSDYKWFVNNFSFSKT